MSDQPPTRKPFRRRLWFLGLLALAMSVVSVSLAHQYGATRPVVRDEAGGRTHAVRIHQKTVFLTQGEMAFAFATHAIAILAMGAFVGVLMKSRQPQNPAKRP